MALTERLARSAGAAILALGTAVAFATPVAAADPVLPRPTAAVTFLADINFSGSATLSDDVERVEIVVDLEGSSRSIVSDIATSDASGTTPLRFDFATPGGSVLPNTDLAAHFRATLTDGRQIDGPSVTVHYEDSRFDWQTMTGASVTVHWTEGGASFGRRALQIADDAVHNVSDLLGVTESDPIDFFVYADNGAFYDVLGAGARENVGGEAHPDIRTLFAQIAPGAVDDPWVGVVIPHELTHLVFDTAVRNPYHYPPRWLNEGIAEYLSQGYTADYRRDVGNAADGGDLIPLQGLSGQFPTTAARFYLAYAESTSAVDFLVATYGQEAMVKLVRSYAAGVTDDEAFDAALGTDVAGFETAWLDSLGSPALSPFGPVDAPPGPVPSDWIGAGQVPGSIGTSGPSVTPSSPPATSGGGVATDATGIVVLVVVAGLLVAGVGVLLLRRNRSVAVGGGGSEAAAIQPAAGDDGRPFADPAAVPAEPEGAADDPDAAEPPPPVDRGAWP